jgi:hypothetical protein
MDCVTLADVEGDGDTVPLTLMLGDTVVVTLISLLWDALTLTVALTDADTDSVDEADEKALNEFVTVASTLGVGLVVDARL